MIKTYYWLTKPGIVYSNAIAAAAGFFLASRWDFKFLTFISLLAGTSLIVACGGVFNNYIDRDIDKKMKRTKKRALPSGKITGRAALAYGTVLGAAGFGLLALYTNAITCAIGALGLFFYVVVYGAAKRRTPHGTLIGTISGATPPVAGYAAFTNHLDGGALLLFLVLVCWQMPHFYSIAIFRLKDYRAAGLPVLPAVKGLRRTKLEILVYTALFTGVVFLLTIFGYTGVIFLVVMAGLGAYWLWRGIRGFKAKDDTVWARQMFGLSIVVLLSLSVMLAVGSVLP